MERRNFIKTCCYAGVGIPLFGSTLLSCGSIYYAQVTTSENKIKISRSEFTDSKTQKTRAFILVKTDQLDFPICVYHIKNDEYVASLMKCTHRGCELNVGGGVYSCPCHGSEFSIKGEVLEGPADENLNVFTIEKDHENLYIIL